MQNFVGFLLPPAIDYINRYITDSRLKFAVTLLICLVVGAIIHLGDLTWGNIDAILSSSAIVFSEAQVVYKLYWKDSSVRNRITDVN